MKLIVADSLWTRMKEYHERRAEEANMTGDRGTCVTWDDAVILLKNAHTIDIPTGVAIVVHEDGTVSKLDRLFR